MPRPVPPYERQTIYGAWWYCLHCKKSCVGDYECKTHVRQAHFGGDYQREPEKGEDYTNGVHLRVLVERWESWSLLAIDRFHLQVESLRGADDLAVEVGDGIPE